MHAEHEKMAVTTASSELLSSGDLPAEITTEQQPGAWHAYPSGTRWLTVTLGAALVASLQRLLPITVAETTKSFPASASGAVGVEATDRCTYGSGVNTVGRQSSFRLVKVLLVASAIATAAHWVEAHSDAEARAAAPAPTVSNGVIKHAHGC